MYTLGFFVLQSILLRNRKPKAHPVIKA